MSPVTLPPDSTLIQDIDELVSDIIGAARKPSITTIMVVVAQVIAFIVAFGIIDNTQAGELTAIISAAVNVAILIAHGIKQNAAHKAVSGIVQAKLDLVNSGTLPEGALLGRAGGRRV